MRRVYLLAALGAFIGFSAISSAESRTMSDIVTIERDDDLRLNKKAIHVSIARNKEKVTIDSKITEIKGKTPGGATRPNAKVISVESDDAVKKFNFSTSYEVLAFEKNINNKYDGQNNYDNVHVGMVLGHELTHVYDMDRMPLHPFSGYIKGQISNVAEKAELQRLSDELTILMEGRAVFNEILTYAAYLKKCQIAGKDAYRRLRNTPATKTLLPAAVLKNMTDAQLLYFAHDAVVNQYGNGKIHDTATSYVDALKMCFSQDPLQYAINLGFNFTLAMEGYVTPESVMLLDSKQQDKLLKQYEQYEKYAMEMLQKYQGDSLFTFANSTTSMELVCDLYLSHTCQLVNILNKIQNKDSAEAVSSHPTSIMPKWYAHHNEIYLKSKAIPALSEDEVMIFFTKVLPMRAEIYKQYLLPEIDRLQRANYYECQALKDWVQKAENTQNQLHLELRESGRKGAKKILGL